jgi:NAD(P)H-hydrate epimerase
VLKGRNTVIAEPGGAVWINTTGNPGMAKGGTGDVLTGMIAGIVAQHPDRVLESVIAGVYMHGLAGDVARNMVGEYAMLATDILAMLPFAFERLRERTAAKWTMLAE